MQLYAVMELWETFAAIQSYNLSIWNVMRLIFHVPCLMENHKANVDPSWNSHASWELMKEILQTKDGYKMMSKIEKLSCFWMTALELRSLQEDDYQGSTKLS